MTRRPRNPVPPNTVTVRSLVAAVAQILTYVGAVSTVVQITRTACLRAGDGARDGREACVGCLAPDISTRVDVCRFHDRPQKPYRGPFIGLSVRPKSLDLEPTLAV